MRFFPILALLLVAACAAEPDAPSSEGTENPQATTPVEVPADAFQDGLMVDSTAPDAHIFEDPAPDSTDG